jgi:uncharacterized GH25 family protein
MSQVKPAWTRFACCVALTFCTASAGAHQLWVETDPTGKAGEEQAVHVCWGHSGHKETGQSLHDQQSRLGARLVRPDGRAGPLDLAEGSDRFTAKMTPQRAGCYVIGAESQVGIIDEEFHGIPANTRIVMYGKSVVQVEAGENGLQNRVGSDLAIVPVTNPQNLRPGDIVTAKVLLMGKPIGGREVVVSLKTVGTVRVAEDPRLQSREWSTEANADPRSGEVSFPLIVGGQHLFYIMYYDEKPGSYEGDRQERSEFSHLRKGDSYERTLYVSTLTVDVKDE